MKRLILSLTFISMLLTAQAQQLFITAGKIEFEKKTNLHKQLELDNDEGWREMIKKTIPAVKTTYFDMYFKDAKTIYLPGREVVSSQQIPGWFEGPANDNVVYTDLHEKMFSSQKTVFEDVFNIHDTLRRIKWKMTPETRTIAGFECRKATAIIMDSIFVVAFYTNQIITPGGPESFTGLPGMILGLALPRLYTTWFATKLEMVDVKEATLVPPKKGRKTNLNALKIQLQPIMKNWGTMGDKNLWQIMI